MCPIPLCVACRLPVTLNKLAANGARCGENNETRLLGGYSTEVSCIHSGVAKKEKEKRTKSCVSWSVNHHPETFGDQSGHWSLNKSTKKNTFLTLMHLFQWLESRPNSICGDNDKTVGYLLCQVRRVPTFKTILFQYLCPPPQVNAPCFRLVPFIL